MKLRDNNNAGWSEDASQLLFLNLFLLLFVFFIFLKSLSAIEESRSRRVLNPIAATFRILLAPKADSPIVIADLGPMAKPERLLSLMQQPWVTPARLQNVRTRASGRVMEMTMPANEMFPGGPRDLAPGPPGTVSAVDGVFETVGNRIDIYGHRQPVSRGQGEKGCLAPVLASGGSRCERVEANWRRAQHNGTGIGPVAI